MKDKRFSMRCDDGVLKKAREYAKERRVPLAQLVDQFLRELGKAQEDRPKADEELGVEQA